MRPNARAAAIRTSFVGRSAVRLGRVWRSLGDSNPCFRRERATSWAARRRERLQFEIAAKAPSRKHVRAIPEIVYWWPGLAAGFWAPLATRGLRGRPLRMAAMKLLRRVLRLRP